ncbi:MAG: twin-arginine translocase subunit TatC [Opitutus sp.]|nr:twin-arginine translocase subunit TatC [Opitutus sp.]
MSRAHLNSLRAEREAPVCALSTAATAGLRPPEKLHAVARVSQPPPDEDFYEAETLGAAGVAPKKTMGFLDHLEELRGTLIKCAVVFAIVVAVIAYYMKDFSYLLNWPLDHVRAEYPGLKTDLVTNSPMAVFSVIISICVTGGFILSLPFFLFFFGQFVAPALTQREMKVLLPTAFSALLLFLGGAAFSYFFLVTSTIRVAFELNQLLGYEVLWTADKYYSLLMWMVLGVGASFEFPLLIVLATYMGLVEIATLKKYRRHAIVVFFIIAAIVTPTPDPFTQTIFAVPLILLYELAIWVSAFVGRRKARVE